MESLTTPDYSTPEYWNQRVRDNIGDDQAMLFRDPRFDNYERLVIQFLVSVIRPRDVVLDVCAGFGRFSRLVIGREAEWFGVDFSHEMEKLWKERGAIGGYTLGACQKPDLWCKRSFDLIFEVNSLHVLGWTPIQFRDTYVPYLNRPGRIACLECEEFTVFNYY